MVRRPLAGLGVVAGMLLVASAGSAQGFGLSYADVGPTLGIGGVGSASASVGVRFEKAIRSLPDFGNGMLGIQISGEFYAHSSRGYTQQTVPLGVTANYHFKLDDPKIDPFFGLGLGYQYVSCNYPAGSADVCASSTIVFIGRAGARYFWRPNMAAYGELEAGGATLHVGMMFKLQ